MLETKSPGIDQGGNSGVESAMALTVYLLGRAEDLGEELVYAHRVVVVDMLGLGNSICDYFVICQGNSPTQVNALAGSIEDTVRINCGKKPYAVDGLRNSQWVAMDYGDILVHIFLPDVRTFYDIEHLWADAKITSIPDLD